MKKLTKMKGGGRMVFRKKKNNDIKDKIEKAVVKPKEINKPDNYKLVSDSLKELESVQAELWGHPKWENLRDTLDRRFPQKFFIPNPLQATLVPEDANVLRPLNE